MKKVSLLIATYFIFISFVNAQQTLIFNGEKIKDSRIYILLNGTELEYFTHEKTEDGKSKMKDDQKFSLKDRNNCNIYIKWINPLKYHINWKDSVSLDDRDKSIQDFVGLLTAQFGSSVTSLSKLSNKKELQYSKALLNTDETSIQGLDDGFNSLKLTSLFIQLNLSIKNISEDERKKITELVPLLVILDDKNNRNVSDELDKLFIDLFSEVDPTTAKSMIVKCKGEVEKYSKYFKDDIELNRKHVLDKLKELKELQDNQSAQTLEDIKALDKNYKKVTDTAKKLVIKMEMNALKNQISSSALISSLINLSVNEFIFDVNSLLLKNKVIVAKFPPIIEILDKSLSIKSVHELTSDYYYIRNLTFENGKKLETTFSITEFKYSPEKKEFIKEKDISTNKMTFEKYDLFAISVSTGIFYSSTTLKGFGVTDNLTITEDDITQNNPMTAVFMNFNFGVSSRYFAPLAQIGIDPTKKRPFLLLGGGFSIPSAQIAITGGPIWTWNPTLDQLTVGQTIESTTALEKDLEYKFEVKPKGWYIGIQYNF